MCTLYSYRSESEVSLQQAIQHCSAVWEGKKTVALLYSPYWCRFGKLEGGVLYGSDGNPLNLDTVYEARVFHEDAELRWVNNNNYCGDSVLISENKSCIDGFNESGNITILKKLDQSHTYLLWGELAIVNSGDNRPLAKGWSRLTTARIGSLDIPLDGLTNRARIKAVEYLNIIDDHGNVGVIDERLVALEAA